MAERLKVELSHPKGAVYLTRTGMVTVPGVVIEAETKAKDLAKKYKGAVDVRVRDLDTRELKYWSIVK